jgi:hypothetical protein
MSIEKTFVQFCDDLHEIALHKGSQSNTRLTKNNIERNNWLHYEH